MKHALVVLTLMCLPALAQAQAIWRCGPDGRSFSDTPCAEGRVLAVADTRPGRDVAEARVLSDREIRLAEKLRRERLREERTQLGNGLAALGPVSAGSGVKPRHLEQREEQRQEQRQAPPAKPALRQPRAATDETFRAVDPASRRAKG